MISKPESKHKVITAINKCKTNTEALVVSEYARYYLNMLPQHRTDLLMEFIAWSYNNVKTFLVLPPYVWLYKLDKVRPSIWSADTSIKATFFPTIQFVEQQRLCYNKDNISMYDCGDNVYVLTDQHNVVFVGDDLSTQYILTKYMQLRG